MRAVTIDAFGQMPDVRQIDVPADVPAGRILVRVHAAGVNPIDSLIARGLFTPFPVTFPLTLGLDFAGVVDRAGDAANRYAEGDRVCGRAVGTFADYVLVAENETVSPIPESIGFAEAAALPSAGMTALTSVEAAGIAGGSRVLIVGAAGGVGSFAVQFARRRGGYVIATAREEDAAYVKTLGANETVDYTRDDAMFPQDLDALLDFASGAPALVALSGRVRKGGAVVSTRYVADVDTLAKRDIRAINIKNQPTAELMRRVTEAVANGEVAVPEIHTYPLEQAAEVLARFERGQHVRGKLVLLP
ncbi:MAG TPA: NADP-dependent oxidoreductase [Thermoanaerobaculia bacterium]|nr:NADP-dependent oxidoreductase [Thermoanaerobaculia bacterium]